MRVAYLVNEARVTAGWGRYAVEVIKGLGALGVEPVLLTHSPQIDPALAGIEHHPLLRPVLSLRLNTPRTLLSTPALRRILATCELAHCMTELYAPLTALGALGQCPYVVNAHGTWAIRPLETAASRALFRPAFRRAHTLICLSDFTRQWMARLMPLPNAQVLTGGVRIEDYDRPVDVRLPGWAAGKKIVFTAGAFKQRKGQHVTLEAIALARQHIPDLHWVLTGDPAANPAYTGPLLARIQELGLGEGVHFLGTISQDELVAWYQGAEVFVLTQVNDGSSFEGLGMVFLEAGAVRTPSIGSRDCGAEAAIVDGLSGFLTPQNDPPAIAAALIKLLSDEGLRKSMGEAARQQAERLSWEALCRSTYEIYQAALGR
jgi:glycosyltransferase involved in cell wall biosynthesis